MPVTGVTDPAVAVLLAQAHRAVHGVAAVSHVGGGPSWCPDRARAARTRPDPADAVVVEDVESLRALAPLLAERVRGDGLRLQVGIDLAQPVADGPVAHQSAAQDWAEPDEALLRDVAGASRVVVLAGPGVVESGSVGALRALAAAGRLGVLNTWGAKGVFHWQSRHHWATVGLQARDFELGGVPEADLVLAVGVDEREAPRRLWEGGTSVREVAPEVLGPLAERWPVAARDFPDVPPLRERLAAVTQAGWTVVRHAAHAVAGDASLRTGPGRDRPRRRRPRDVPATRVARTFATTRLRSVFVPAAPTQGWATACVLVARLLTPLRPALAVVDGAVGERGSAVLAEAARLGVGIGIEAWDSDGEPCGAGDHVARLDVLVSGQPGAVTSTLATESRQLTEMVDAAGPVRAWTGDERPPG